MKNKIFSIIAILGATMLGACDDFLDQTPDKSGSAYIYHMDQLYGLTGNPELYTLFSASYASLGILVGYTSDQFYMSDAVEYDPRFWFTGMKGGSSDIYRLYCWDKELLKDQSTMNSTWTPCWARIYTFNTVIENLDKVIQTTPEVRKQVEGEARFGRAYYHFLLMAQYCLWREDAPGIGYRDNTNASEVPPRQTVAYTLSRIYEDLELAEAALRAAGRTQFEHKRNLRPTVPTLQAFRARVDLYRGDYESALRNATDALAAHNTLVTFKDDPQYALFPSTVVNLLDETDTRIAGTITSQVMTTLNNLRSQPIAEYEELYLPHCASSSMAPMSEAHYDLFDRENDARWIHFYSNYQPLLSATGIVQPVVLEGDDTATPNCIRWADQQWLKPSSCHAYRRFFGTNKAELIGMTTAEMYLIRAECLARSGKTAEAAEALRTLRRTRFITTEAADNTGGTVQDVLDERAREMGPLWRVWETKRLNGAENAGISLRRNILADKSDLNSVTELVIGPDDGRWAMPFHPLEAERMGWQQNEGWE